MFPWGGSTQAPHKYEMVVVVPLVPDGHVLEDPTVRSQNVVRLGPHYPPLPHFYPCPPIPTPRPLSWEEMSRNFDIIKRAKGIEWHIEE